MSSYALLMRRLLCSALLLGPLAAAASYAADETLPGVTTPGIPALLLNLALVLCLIGVCAWLLARGRRHLPGSVADLPIVAARTLGNRERIVVVQVGDEQVLLGITPTSISHLHTLQRALPEPATLPVIGGFAEKLAQWRKPAGKDGSV